MGGFGLFCVVANGTRLLGMSYTNNVHDPESNDPDIVMLVQSNPSPSSLEDISWSVISIWNRDMYYPQDYSPLVCNVDESTGVFTTMSYFGLTDPNYNFTGPVRPPGGFQYDPRTGAWSNFTLHKDYRWKDTSSSFTLFQWPGTSTLYQANIGANNSVNLGMLNHGEFLNVASWSLNPTTHGYPGKLVYGNNAIYQFGTQVGNNRTGALQYTITKIPLPSNPATIDPDSLKLQVYQAPGMQKCTPGYVSSSYYKDSLYVFCQGLDSDVEPGYGVAMVLGSNDTVLQDVYETFIFRLSGAIIQPFDFKGSRQAFVVNSPDEYTMQLISLQPTNFGWTDSVSYQMNVTEPYGFPLGNSSNHTGAIVGGAVGGVVFILLVIFCIIARRRWPLWRRKLRERVLKMTREDDEIYGENNLVQTEQENSDKIEEPPKDYNEITGKILVTDDMDVDDTLDFNKVYMKNVEFERHPKPAFVTTMTNDTSSIHSSENGMTVGSNSHTLRNSSSASTTTDTEDISNDPSIRSKLAEKNTHIPSELSIHRASSSHTRSLETASPPPNTEQSNTSIREPELANSYLDHSKGWTIETSDDDLPVDIAPPYSQHLEVSQLYTPSFPIPPTPTAPAFFSEEVGEPSTNNSQMSNNFEEREEESRVDSAI